ncbi:MAG TPA: DUF2314 domain-containing protein [Chthoniobacterales bacterium]|jgi:uncharacterized protein YegJ (DUF2314 family)
MKTTLILICSLALAGFSHAAEETTHLAGRASKTPGPPGYANVPQDDKAIDAAVDRAQKSLGLFIAALKKKRDGDERFEIKKGFDDGQQVEHIWVDQLTWDGKLFHGRINNKPLDVKNVRLGQSVTVAPRDVSDWMFIRDGKLIGGYTTRIFYRRLSAADRAEFDKEARFTIQ